MSYAKDMQVGYIHHTPCGETKIIKYVSAREVHIEFLSTGYCTTVHASNLRKGKVKDYLKPSVCGVGYLGEGNYKSREGLQETKPYKVWRNMLYRCYSPNYHAYHLYGGRGVTVITSWHNFQVFAEWYSKNCFHNCQVDKDICVQGNLIYSPDTCICVDVQQNVEKASAKYYEFLKPTGEKVRIYNLNKFSREHSLSPSCMNMVAHGSRTHHKGWRLA